MDYLMKFIENQFLYEIRLKNVFFTVSNTTLFPT